MFAPDGREVLADKHDNIWVKSGGCTKAYKLSAHDHEDQDFCQKTPQMHPKVVVTDEALAAFFSETSDAFYQTTAVWAGQVSWKHLNSSKRSLSGMKTPAFCFSWQNGHSGNRFHLPLAGALPACSMTRRRGRIPRAFSNWAWKSLTDRPPSKPPPRHILGTVRYKTPVKEVVAGAGIEPATQGFSVLCSTN